MSSAAKQYRKRDGDDVSDDVESVAIVRPREKAGIATAGKRIKTHQARGHERDSESDDPHKETSLVSGNIPLENGHKEKNRVLCGIGNSDSVYHDGIERHDTSSRREDQPRGDGYEQRREMDFRREKERDYDQRRGYARRDDYELQRDSSLRWEGRDRGREDFTEREGRDNRYVRANDVTQRGADGRCPSRDGKYERNLRETEHRYAPNTAALQSILSGEARRNYRLDREQAVAARENFLRVDGGRYPEPKIVVGSYSGREHESRTHVPKSPERPLSASGAADSAADLELLYSCAHPGCGQRFAVSLALTLHAEKCHGVRLQPWQIQQQQTAKGRVNLGEDAGDDAAGRSSSDKQLNSNTGSTTSSSMNRGAASVTGAQARRF